MSEIIISISLSNIQIRLYRLCREIYRNSGCERAYARSHPEFRASIPLKTEEPQLLKRLASEKSLSLNDFLTQEIEKWADRELRYQQAKERQIALVKKSIDLGFQNDEPPSRDSLHER
jgi:hypothetical protein